MEPAAARSGASQKLGLDRARLHAPHLAIRPHFEGLKSQSKNLLKKRNL
jgi:hypothetical protein